MNIHFSRRKLMGGLVVVTAFFVGMGILVEIVSRHHESNEGFVAFDLDQEWNLPTVYSALLLLIASALLALISAQHGRARASDFRYWIVLSFIFCFFGFDELFSFHNSAKHLVPLWFKQVGLFSLRWDLRWIVIGIPATILIASLFVPFIWRLPRQTAYGIVFAGVVYVGAAIGLEAVGGWWIAKHSRNNWIYSCEVVIEESLEMIGALMFIGVLLAYIERELNGRARLGSVELELESPQEVQIRSEIQV
jgi:hypothetical protein